MLQDTEVFAAATGPPDVLEGGADLFALGDATGPTRRVVFSLDEFGAAKRVLAAYRERFRFATDSQTLLTWDGSRYGNIPHLAEALVKDVLENLHHELDGADFIFDEYGASIKLEVLQRFHHKARSRGMIDKSLRLLRLDPAIHVKSTQFNSGKYLLNTLNGLLDLDSKMLHQHHHSHLVTRIAPVRWNPKAERPSYWIEVVDDITRGDKELAAFLRRLFGYCLSGSTQEEVMPILYGGGGNGKTIFLNRIRKTLGSGEYAITLGAGSILNSKYHGIRCDLAQLNGARVAFAIEVNQGSTLDEAVVKSLTGGDEISARLLRQNPVQFTPQAKILMAVNHLPALVGNDRGISRRLLVVPFNAKFDGKVRKEEIERRLDAEAEGILAWAVEGFLEWRQQGLNPPEIASMATKSYLQTNDHIGAYLAERTQRLAGAKTPLRMLYEDYVSWTKENCTPAVGLHKFSELIRSNSFVQVRDRSARCWDGLALKPIA